MHHHPSPTGKVMDFLTVCLQSDEATVITILKNAPFNHTYVRTFGPFVNDELIFQVYKGGTVSEVGGSDDNGNKVIIHSTKT
jgi:hypothetical protein